MATSSEQSDFHHQSNNFAPSASAHTSDSDRSPEVAVISPYQFPLQQHQQNHIRPDSPNHSSNISNATSNNDMLHLSSQLSSHANHANPVSNGISSIQHLSDSLFVSSANNHSMYNSNIHGLSGDYLSDSENVLLNHSQGNGLGKSMSGFTSPYRPSPYGAFGGITLGSGNNHINGANTGSGANSGGSRLRQQTTSQGYPTAADVYGSQNALVQQQALSASSAFDSRGFEFSPQSSLSNKTPQPYGMDLYAPSSLQLSKSQGQLQQLGNSDAFHVSHPSSAQVPYLNGGHLQSQTPYGPHLSVQSNVSSNVLGTGSTISRALSGGVNPLDVPGDRNGVGNGIVGGNGNGNGAQSEEISTIFVVGFPEDMQEREFQNMFTFSPGFEAATLKIPNKEYTAYGSGGGNNSSGNSNALRSGPYMPYGSNDPYNIVTVNQGGVVVDGRDGLTTSWPAPLSMSLPMSDDSGGHFGSSGQSGQASMLPPRKQIIGFAKFRTRQEAQDARDVLQGRRVDIEKGAVLKAEMAKKNLHTKRGVGMGSANGGGASGANSVGGAVGSISGIGGLGAPGLSVSGGLGGGMAGGMGGLGGANTDALAGIPAGLNLNSISGSGGDSLVGRERELGGLGSLGYPLGAGGWREDRPADVSVREEEERDQKRREREASVISAMGLGMKRGPRERAQADEEERERRRKETIRSSDFTAFDAFHSVPASSSQTTSRHASNGLLSPSLGNSVPPGLGFGLGEGGGVGTSPRLGSGFSGIIPQTGGREEFGLSSINRHGNGGLIGHWDISSPREDLSLGQSLSGLSLGANEPHMSSVIPVPPVRSPSSSHVSQDSPPHSAAFSPTFNNNNVLPPLTQRNLRPFSPGDDAFDHQPLEIKKSHRPSSASSSVGAEGDLATHVAQTSSTGTTSPQLPSPMSGPASAAGSSVGGASGSSGTTASTTGSAGAVGGSIGPRNTAIDQNPPINTLYVGNLPTGPVGGGYPAGYLEDSLRELFSKRPGFRKLCFRQKFNGPMCFVEFESVDYATKALNELYGNTLNGLIKGGGIRLSYSKNPLGVRTPTSAGSYTSLQQQQNHHISQTLNSQQDIDCLPLEIYQVDSVRQSNFRRDASAVASPSYSHSISPPPPRLFSPPPTSSSFSATSSASLTNSTSAFPRGYGYNPGNGSSSTFSPFGVPISSNMHASSHAHSSLSAIPNQTSSDDTVSHDQQHFPHRALSPASSSNLEARAG